jgi:hypothetical protein
VSRYDDPTVAVITSIYGGFDTLRDPPAQQGVSVEEWVCVTDDPDMEPVGPWQLALDENPTGESPRFGAKRAKVFPLDYLDSEPDIVVRMDGAAYLRHGHSLSTLLEAAHGAVIAQYRHPARTCIYDEATAASGQAKYRGQPIFEQVEHYRRAGHPEAWGLWETGVLIYDYRHGTAELLRAFGSLWLDEMRQWTLQDQLSEAVVLRRLGLWPADLPGSYWDNPHVGRQPHLDPAEN